MTFAFGLSSNHTFAYFSYLNMSMNFFFCQVKVVKSNFLTCVMTLDFVTKIVENNRSDR
jgi:hypothetical protein